MAVLLAGLASVGGCAPSTRTPDGRPDGSKLYQIYCVSCHGFDGSRRTGSATLLESGGRSDSELRLVIERGRGAMPAWQFPKGPLHDNEIAAVLQYVRALQPRR